MPLIAETHLRPRRRDAEAYVEPRTGAIVYVVHLPIGGRALHSPTHPQFRRPLPVCESRIRGWVRRLGLRRLP